MLQQFPASLRIMNPVATLQGAQDSLAAINTTLLPDNSIVAVQASDTLYMLRKDSSAAESSPDVIAPDQGGPGRWYRYGAGGGFFNDVVITHITVPPQTSIPVGNIAIPGFESDNDVVSYNLVSSGLDAALVVGLPRNTGSGLAEFYIYNISGATVAAGTLTLRVCVHDSP